MWQVLLNITSYPRDGLCSHATGFPVSLIILLRLATFTVASRYMFLSVRCIEVNFWQLIERESSQRYLVGCRNKQAMRWGHC